MSSQKKRGRPKKIKFEDKIEEIQENIEKRRGKWFLKAINWISWEDVSQIILAHIHKKWHQWDQKRPLAPWLNRIISNQIKNTLRNHYTNFIRPCVQCPFNISGSISQVDKENLCSWTKSGQQDNLCPLFKKWDSSKKYCQGINMAGNVDDFVNQRDRGAQSFDIDKSKDKLNTHMKKRLNEKQYKIYYMIFMKGMKPEIVAEKMGYKSNEKGRRAGYKQIKNFETLFKKLAKKIIEEEDIT
jgi:hypothetical protein